MWFIGKNTRSLRDFLEGSFPVKDKCPPTQHPLPPFYSHPLNKYYCVHTPDHGCHRRSDLPVSFGDEVCLSETLFISTLSRTDESSSDRWTLVRDLRGLPSAYCNLNLYRKHLDALIDLLNCGQQCTSSLAAMTPASFVSPPAGSQVHGAGKPGWNKVFPATLVATPPTGPMKTKLFLQQVFILVWV